MLSAGLLLEIQRWFGLEEVIDRPLFTLHSSSRETRPSLLPQLSLAALGAQGPLLEYR